MSGDNPYEAPPSSAAAEPKPPPQSAEGKGPEAKDAKMWALFAHLSPAVLSLIGVGVFGGSFLGPLIIWLIKKDENDFIADQAKEALNFQLTLLIGLAIGWAITLVTCLTVPVVVIIPILQLVFGIIGGIKANNGEWYRYPFSIRVVT
jgi:hypothetical protein